MRDSGNPDAWVSGMGEDFQVLFSWGTNADKLTFGRALRRLSE